MSADVKKRETWSGSLGFVLAAVGSAVGLGNVWKFPYITGENGGGAFVLVYLACIMLVGLPLLVAEMTLGRRSRMEPVGTFKSLAGRDRGGSWWVGFGALMVLTAVLLLSFYSVVGGWAIAYLVKALQGEFTPEGAARASDTFTALTTSPWEATLYHALFMGGCIGVVIGGVSQGIERGAKVMMPALAGLLLVLLMYSLSTPGAGESLRFMFYPDFSKLTPAAVLEAMGHSFFTLSLGMGIMIVFGSYLSKKESIAKSSLMVVGADTVIALVAGVMIFGIVFSAGKDPEAGAGLVFITLPSLFANLPLGNFWAALFFLLLSFAALTSGISILEVSAAFLVDEGYVTRKKATLGIGAIIFILGLVSVLSFSVLDGIKIPVPGKPAQSIFDALDYYISNWALTINGLGVALFAGWGIRKDDLWEELKDDLLGRTGFFAWFFIIRFFTPIAVILVLLHSVGWLSVG